MATIRIPILTGSVVPDTSANVYAVSYIDKAPTNDVWGHLIWVFEEVSSPRIGLHGSFNIPKGYVGTANLIVVWTAAVATSGDVEWDFDYRAVGGNDTESLDQSGNQESINSNDTAPSAVNERMEISISLTDGNFAVDDTVQFTLFRDGTDDGDTMNDDALLFDLLFEYSDA